MLAQLLSLLWLLPNTLDKVSQYTVANPTQFGKIKKLSLTLYLCPFVNHVFNHPLLKSRYAAR